MAAAASAGRKGAVLVYTHTHTHTHTCTWQLRQVLDDREQHLLAKVRETEQDKLATIERQREQ